MPHRNYSLDYTVDVVIIYRDKALLRLHDKYKRWFLVGGHIEVDEVPEDAARREVLEETGLSVELIPTECTFNYAGDGYRQLTVPLGMNVHKINDVHNHMSLVYVALSYSDKVKPQYEADRSDDCVWLTRDELIAKTDLDDLTRQYCLTGLDIVSKLSK